MSNTLQIGFDYALLPVDVAVKAQTAASNIKLLLKRTSEDIIEIGRELTAVKDQLPHGQFLPWIAAEFEMSERTARDFMQVADRFGGKSAIIADLKPTILYALAAPSTPESVVLDITARVEAGEKVKVKDVQAAIKKAKSNVVEFPKNSQSDLPIPPPKPQVEVFDANPMMRQLGIPDGWLSRFMSVHRDLQAVYNRHFAGNDRDLFVFDFIAAMPADTDLTCVFQLSDFLVKLIASLPRKVKEVSHG